MGVTMTSVVTTSSRVDTIIVLMPYSPMPGLYSVVNISQLKCGMPSTKI